MAGRILSELFIDIPGEILSSIDAVRVVEVVSDSRRIVPGSLFIAVRGSNYDGHRYIPEAVNKGAVAVVGMEQGVLPGVPYVQVRDTRMALPYIAAAFYGHPGRKLSIVGVTGTDGKTTTTNLIYQIMQAAGLKAGMVSTVNAVIGDQVMDTGFHVTTPEPIDVQHYLAMMVESGLTHAVLETTSHGWAQHRVDGCEFDVGVITNITHEHLDEHGSLDNYRQAKARLFQSLVETQVKSQGNPRTAVLNMDDASYGFLKNICDSLPGVKTLTYGMQSGAWYRAMQVSYSRQGVTFELISDNEAVHISSPLVGAYNIANILAAYAATVGALGINPKIAQMGIKALGGIPGRMEAIDMGQNFLVYVDFAHTPNALHRTLETAREMTRGRVIVTFGAAGLRDRQKRHLMAECAMNYADLVVLTAEDPRSESLGAILEEMKKGAEATGGVEGKSFWRIPDRGEAIRKVLSLAQPGDIVLACGKGHEKSMCFGSVEYAWDDRVAMRAALADHLGVTGPAMPYLPTQESFNRSNSD